MCSSKALRQPDLGLRPFTTYLVEGRVSRLKTILCRLEIIIHNMCHCLQSYVHFELSAFDGVSYEAILTLLRLRNGV